jgi:DNA-binding IclR family transcriptional regulator
VTSTEQSTPSAGRGTRSQTLERALDVLSLLADGRGRSSREIADEVGLHRSIVYRILRTFEDRSMVARAASGRYQLGLGLAALAGSGLGALQADVELVLQELADATGTTAVFCTGQLDQTVVLTSARPQRKPASVMISAGSRFPLRSGAPGAAILSLAPLSEDDSDETRLARQTGYTHSKGEPFVGVETAAVPLRLVNGEAAALAVVAPIGGLHLQTGLKELRYYAQRLAHPDDAWST